MAGDAIVITPSRGWQPLRLAELWSFRELAAFIIWRELKVRYKQTALGASWAVLQPVLMTVIFTIVFGRWLRVGTGGSGPYAVFAFAAMVPWTLFSQGLARGAQSLVSGSSLISRVYFPRLVLPIGTVLSFLVDFAIALVLLFILMAVYGYYPSIEVLALPLFVVLLLVAAMGVSFLLAAANAQYRDVAYVTPFLLQLWFFATPVVYPVDIVPEGLHAVYAINPMVSVATGFRWAFLDGASPFSADIAVSAAAAVVLFLAGAYYFRRMERSFADVL